MIKIIEKRERRERELREKREKEKKRKLVFEVSTLWVCLKAMMIREDKSKKGGNELHEQSKCTTTPYLHDQIMYINDLTF